MAEWKYKRLGDIADVGTGKSNRQDAQDYGIYPFFIRSKDIIKINSYEFDEEAIIIPGEGGIGDIFHYIYGKYALHQRAYRIHFITNEVNTKYAYYYMHKAFKNYINMKAVCATVVSIRKPMIDDFVIPLPPLAEQERIAGALSAVDGLIEALDARIEKTRNIKQGTMQHLLNPLYNNPSLLKPLGEVVQMQRGTSITKKDIRKGKIPVIAGGQRPAYYCDVSNRMGETITISGSGEYAGYVAYWNEPIFVSDAFSIKGTKNSTTKYLYYVLRGIQNKIYATKKGAGVPHVHSNDIEDFLIPLPSLAEQERIASILTALDDEIAALEARRAKYAAVKSGMLQALLTGAIRLSKSASECK